MNAFVLEFVETFKKKVGKQNRVLEVGALDVNGSARKFFTDADEYIGLDQEAGNSVDVVDVSYNIPKLFKKASFDCVICCETLEHDPKFWVTLECMKWALKPGGWMLITAPTRGQELHRYPIDVYRFMPDAFLSVMFPGFKDVHMIEAYEYHKDGKIQEIPTTIGCYGRLPLKNECGVHTWSQEEYEKTWKGGGFGDGTLIRHCLRCKLWEICNAGENAWKFGGSNWKE